MAAIINEFLDKYDIYVRTIGAILLFLIFYFPRKKYSKGILTLISKLFFRNNEKQQNAIKNSLQKPLSVLFAVFGIFFLLYIPAKYISTGAIALAFLKIGGIITICWGIVNYLSDNLFFVLHFSGDSNDSLNTTAIKFISNILKFIVGCVGVVMVISELGYNINGLLTGIGVGGLAVSLAAQDAVKNLISGFVIIFDKPFMVGEVIQTPNITGTVEDITIRSTRIRTFADSVTVVPNSVLADALVTNLSRMHKKLIDKTIGITYDADIKTIKKCRDDIKHYLETNEEIDKEVIRVNFTELADSSQNISIWCYTKTTEMPKYIEVCEALNFKVKEIVENNGAEFAFPSTSVYIEKER